MIKKYYINEDYTKEISVIRLIEYIEKNDWSSRWLVNDYSIYVDELIEERERLIDSLEKYLKEIYSYELEKAKEEKEEELRELKCIKYLIKNSYKLIEE